MDLTKQARLARRSQQDSAARTNPTVVKRTRHTRPDVGAQVEEGATAESAEVISRKAGRSIRAGGSEHTPMSLGGCLRAAAGG